MFEIFNQVHIKVLFIDEVSNNRKYALITKVPRKGDFIKVFKSNKNYQEVTSVDWNFLAKEEITVTIFVN